MILSVSGSAARKKTFFCLAKSVTARPMFDRNVPAISATPLARDQLLGDAHRVARVAVVVARDHLELLAEHAAGGVDLLDRELPALLVRLEEGGLRLVAVDLADLDGALRAGAGRRRRARRPTGGERARASAWNSWSEDAGWGGDGKIEDRFRESTMDGPSFREFEAAARARRLRRGPRARPGTPTSRSPSTSIRSPCKALVVAGEMWLVEGRPHPAPARRRPLRARRRGAARRALRRRPARPTGRRAGNARLRR